MSHLPDESAFKQALASRIASAQEDEEPKSPDPFRTIEDWPLTDQLLAHVIDLLAISNWQRGGGKGGKPKLMSSGPKRSAKPAANIDVRSTLARLAPQQQEQPAVTE